MKFGYDHLSQIPELFKEENKISTVSKGVGNWTKTYLTIFLHSEGIQHLVAAHHFPEQSRCLDLPC